MHFPLTAKLKPMETDGRLSTSEERGLLIMREARDMMACLDAFEALLRQYVDVDGYSINLYQPAYNSLACVRVHLPQSLAGVAQTFASTVIPAEGENASARVFGSRVPAGITLNNLGDYPVLTRDAFEQWNMRHMVILPIQVSGSGGRPIGTLMLFSQRNSLAPTILRRITRVVEEAAALLRLHQTIASWEARAESIRYQETELESLLHFVAEMSSIVAADTQMYPRIENEFLRRFDMDMAGILIAEDGQLRCVDTVLVDAEHLLWAERWYQHCRDLSYSVEQPDGASGNAFVHNQPLFFGDIPSIRGLSMSGKDKANLDILEDLLSFAIIPIRKMGHPIGILWLGSRHRKNALNVDQTKLAVRLCDFLGSTIDNARAYARLMAKG